MTKLVIVESPTKARTIRSYLPKDYRVEASMGHIRDLPSSAAEIPAKIKNRKWARMGVDVENNFEPIYVIPKGKHKIVNGLKKLIKESDELFLATDEDREGESIGWHLAELLKPTIPVRRMVFHEITREAIRNAIASPRAIDMNLVRAQEARRILDRLVGYTISPLLWKKLAPKLSAGRVQSVTVRLLVDRERERRSFHTAYYRDLKALLNKRPDQPEHRFEAELFSLDGKILARGKDFDNTTGRLLPGKDVFLLDPNQANNLIEVLKKESWLITDIQEKSVTRSPSPPFTTATLQIEANRKLDLGAAQTMKIAQKLYESGYITYMRTDSVNLSDEAINAARRRILEEYGSEFLSPTPKRYRTKEIGAQEAHEAIRPAGNDMIPPGRLPLNGPEYALYDLIWKRTLATQMKPARLKFQTVSIQVLNAVFRANGRIIEFPGFFRVYGQDHDKNNNSGPNRAYPLPQLTINEEVDCREIHCREHETKPPARFTEAALVKVLKDEGIGRPSTYASIINTIIKRGYVFQQRKELVPTFTAFAVTRMMEKYFTDLVDINFTAEMEEHLDNIARGDKGWLEYLRHFYFGEEGLQVRIEKNESEINPRELCALKLDDPPGEVRIGRYGPFLSWEEDGEKLRTSIATDIPPADLTPELIRRLMEQKSAGPQKLGTDPETGLPVYLKLGPFGAYVQKGENDNNGIKPKRIRLPKHIPMETINLNKALELLQLPRKIGVHPETGKAIKTGLGRFGPYILHDEKFVSLKSPYSVLDVSLEDAIKILAAAADKKGKNSKKALRDLGAHPRDEKPVRIMTGRYGPYINHNQINASIPNKIDPDKITIDEAIKLLEKKAQKKKTNPKQKKSMKKKT